MRMGTYNCLGYENVQYPGDIRLNLEVNKQCIDKTGIDEPIIEKNVVMNHTKCSLLICYRAS